MSLSNSIRSTVFSFVLGLMMFLIIPITSVSAQQPLTFTATPGVVITNIGDVNNPTPVETTLTVPVAVPITKVTVMLNLNHTHAGDLRITLTHVDTGTSVRLLERADGPDARFAFGCGSDGIFATFDDDAPMTMDEYDCSPPAFETPITGVWKPTQPLASFIGQSTAGQWRLSIGDRLVQDDGVLNSWSLMFNTNVPMEEMVEMVPFTPPCSTFSDPDENLIFQFSPPSNALDGIYCQLIAASTKYVRTAGEVGIQSVVDLGVIHAVDVYGPPQTETTAAGSSVCFAGVGNVLFMSASGIPREAQPLAASITGTQTCAILPTDGTVILVGEFTGGSIEATTDTAMDTPLSVPNSRTLTNCRITTNYMLNIREAPSLDSDILDMVPYQINLEATERTADWIRVIYLDFQGWLSADFLDTQGDCAYQQ